MKPDGYVPDILIRGLSVKLRRGQDPKKLWIPYVSRTQLKPFYSLKQDFENRRSKDFLAGNVAV